MLLGTDGMEQGSVVGCDGPVCQDKVLATEALGAGSRQGQRVLALSSCALCPPQVAVRRRVLVAGMELGTPGLGRDLSPSPMPSIADSGSPFALSFQFRCHWRPSAVRVPGATAAGVGTGAGGAQGEHSGDALHSSDSPLTPQGLHPAEQFRGGLGGPERHLGDRAGGAAPTACMRPRQWLWISVAARERQEVGRRADMAGFGSSPKTWG